MLQAIFKLGLCALSAFGSPMPYRMQSMSGTVPVTLQANGPGRLRLLQNDTAYVTQTDSTLSLDLDSSDDLQIEAVGENSRITSLQINGESQPNAAGKSFYKMDLLPAASIKIEADFAYESDTVFAENETADAADSSVLSGEKTPDEEEQPGTVLKDVLDLDEYPSAGVHASPTPDLDDIHTEAAPITPQLIALDDEQSTALQKERAAKDPEPVSIVRSEYFSKVAFNGGSISNYLWTLSNGLNGFCASYMDASPVTGVLCESVRKVDNANLRKALYSGYGGKNNLLAGLNFTRAQQIMITNDLVSMAYSNTCISKGEIGGAIWNSTVRRVWEVIMGQPDPANYVAYVALFPGSGVNHQGTNKPYQPLAFGAEKSNPALQILKSSRNTMISNLGQDNYSLEGAIYHLKKGPSYEQGQDIADLVIGKNLASPVTEVPEAGTYWVKEIKAPKGFALSSEITRIEVSNDNSVAAPVRKLVYDMPQYAPIDLLLQKTEGSSNAGAPSLAGARFEVCYYPADPKRPNASLGRPAGVWNMIAGANGEVRPEKGYFESSTDFLRINGQAVFPIGVVTIQETKAPDGYALNDKIYRIPIDPGGSSMETLKLFQAPKIPNRKTRLQLVKRDGDSKRPLAGAEFSLRSPSGKETRLVCDANGQAELQLPENGTWRLRETKAPAGYTLLSQEILLKADEKGISASVPQGGVSVELEHSTLYVDNFSDLRGALKIRKTDQNGTPLSGAVFALYEHYPEEERKIAEATSGPDGFAHFPNLALDSSYYVREIKAPEGCDLPLDENGDPIFYEFTTYNNDGQIEYWVGEDVETVEPDKPYPPFSLEESGSLQILVLDVVNYKTYLLPETGAFSELACLAGGSLAVGSGLHLKRRKRSETGENE